MKTAVLFAALLAPLLSTSVSASSRYEVIRERFNQGKTLELATLLQFFGSPTSALCTKFSSQSSDIGTSAHADFMSVDTEAGPLFPANEKILVFSLDLPMANKVRALGVRNQEVATSYEVLDSVNYINTRVTSFTQDDHYVYFFSRPEMPGPVSYYYGYCWLNRE